MDQDSDRILVVDDDAVICEMFAKGLKQAGYKCSTAGSAEDAMRVLQQEEFELLLLDLSMPGKGGLNLLSELGRRYPDMATMVVTGSDNTSTIVHAMREGAYDYLTKPVTPALLTLRVQKALARRVRLVENQNYDGENQAYQVEDEADEGELVGLVYQLNHSLEQAKLELAALQDFIKTHMPEDQSIAGAYARLESAATEFGSGIDSLTNVAKGIGTPPAPPSGFIMSGDAQLDEKFGGGIPIGSLTLLEGTSSSGKSVISQTFMYGALKDALGVVCYTSEETPQSLRSQMRSLGMDVDECPPGYKLSVIPLENPDPVEGGDFLLAALAMAIANLPDGSDLIVVDAMTNQASFSGERAILSFIASCKRVCAMGKAIILVVHSSILDEKMMVRVRAICDGHISLDVENRGGQYYQMVEVRKVHQARQPTGMIFNIEILPEIGIQVQFFAAQARG